MALSTKTIRKSIRSIGNTKKITKAMEMVSAAKMRKAVNAVLASRAYAQTAWQMVINLAERVDQETHPLFSKRAKIENVAMILISSNRGLCGGFNSQIISHAMKQINELRTLGPDVKFHWLTVGKKGGESLVRNGFKVVADFEKPDLVTTAGEIAPLAKMVSSGYLNHTYDKIFVIYTDFRSALIQKPRIKQLLPLEKMADQELGSVNSENLEANKTSNEILEYLFEPSPAEVLNLFLPHLIEIELYQALLESNASEHSARMMAMKNASSAASDMIDGLTLMFNQARQASITREIAEISGGKAALEQV